MLKFNWYYAIVLYFSSGNFYFSAIAPTTSSSYIPSTMSYSGKYSLHCPRQQFKGLFTWYRSDFHSETRSFHLQMFLCICSLYTVTKSCFSPQIKPFRFSFEKKFSFLYGISFWKQTSFRIENRKSCSLRRLAHEYAKTMLSPSVLSCECNTNLSVEPIWYRDKSHSGII